MSFIQGKSDTQLWQGLLEGNKSDFAALYQQYVRDLFNYGFKITSNTEMVRDAIQDLFIEIWNSRTNSTQVINVKFYLFKALRYKIFRLIKKESTRPDDYDPGLVEDSIDESWVSLELEAEQLNHLQNFIQELPIRQQEALNLKYYQNFSSDEIARIMEINYQSVSNLLFKALETLRKKFKLKPSNS